MNWGLILSMDNISKVFVWGFWHSRKYCMNYWKLSSYTIKQCVQLMNWFMVIRELEKVFLENYVNFISEIWSQIIRKFHETWKIKRVKNIDVAVVQKKCESICVMSCQNVIEKFNKRLNVCRVAEKGIWHILFFVHKFHNCVFNYY